MTPQEFKAWFDGYTEALDGLPSKKQWDRIKSRVAEIDGKETTHTVFVNRYWTYPVAWNGYVAQNAVSNNIRDDGHSVQCSYTANALVMLGQADAQADA